jgi:hypothetical protein
VVHVLCFSVQRSVNDPRITPIGNPVGPAGMRWTIRPVLASMSAEVVVPVRPENVAAVISVRLTSSRMNAAEPVPGDAFGGVS